MQQLLVRSCMKCLNRNISYLALIPHSNSNSLREVHLSVLSVFLLLPHLLWRDKLLVKTSTSQDSTIQTLAEISLNTSSTEQNS